VAEKATDPKVSPPKMPIIAGHYYRMNYRHPIRFSLVCTANAIVTDYGQRFECSFHIFPLNFIEKIGHKSRDFAVLIRVDPRHLGVSSHFCDQTVDRIELDSKNIL
jgi:hypothetical protein